METSNRYKEILEGSFVWLENNAEAQEEDFLNQLNALQAHLESFHLKSQKEILCEGRRRMREACNSPENSFEDIPENPEKTGSSLVAKATSLCVDGNTQDIAQREPVSSAC